MKHLRRILIVDDDHSIIEILSEVLNDENFEVKVLPGSDQITRDVQGFQPDIILMDFILPNRNGGELCHELKATAGTSTIPVIMYSAFPKVLQSLGDYGADTFVEKPFDLWYLLDVIKSYCEKSYGDSEKRLSGTDV